MLQATLPELARIQEPVKPRLDRLASVLRELVVDEFGPIEEVNDYLLLNRGTAAKRLAKSWQRAA